MTNDKFHEPVLVQEVLEYLHIKKDSKVIDATLGLGGHTTEFVKRGAKVLGIDADEESIKIADEKLKQACPGEYYMVPTPFKLVHGNFRDIEEIAKKYNFENINGILADLGVSTHQLTSSERGMSFQKPSASLDMRMDRLSNKVKASDLLNLLRREQLRDLFLVTMPFKEALKLANNVDSARHRGKTFETVGDLLALIPGYKSGKIDPSTLPFLALRMATNSEIPNLIEFLPKAFSLLKQGGSLVLISFHSGEDRIVKNFFKNLADSGEGEIQTPMPIIPDQKEFERNHRSRSAKLRAITKK